jgi:hypothetical protein
VKAKEGEDVTEIKRKHDAVNKEQKIRNESKREITKFDVDENVVEGKRIRKKKSYGEDFEM